MQIAKTFMGKLDCQMREAPAGKFRSLIEGELQVSTLNLQINSPRHMIMEDDMRF